MNQRSRITGQTTHTTSNDAEEALRRVQGRPAPTTNPLFALIPADQLGGDLIQLIEVGDGLVTVVATPDSEWGTFNVAGWRALSQTEIDIDTQYFGGEPIGFADYVISIPVQDDSELPARVAEAVEYTEIRLAELV